MVSLSVKCVDKVISFSRESLMKFLCVYTIVRIFVIPVMIGVLYFELETTGMCWFTS